MKKLSIVVCCLFALAACAPGMKDLPKLQSKLSTADVKIRMKAVQKMGQITGATPEVLPILYGVLKTDSNSGVRAVAAKSLQNLGFTEAQTPLQVALKDDKSPEVRSAAAESLYGLAGFNALESLTQGTSDLNAEVRAVCVKYVGEIGGERASKTIRGKLKNDTSPIVRTQAVSALGQMKDVQGFELVKDAIINDTSLSVKKAAVVAIGNYSGEDSMNVLCTALKDTVLQDAAIESIHENNRSADSKEAITLLMAAFDADPEKIKDDRIIDIFIQCNDMRVKPYYRKYILYPWSDRDKFEGIVKMLKRNGDTTMVPQLISDLRGVRKSSRIINIVTALGHFQDRRATPVLLSMIRNRSQYKSHVPSHLFWALDVIGDPSSAGYLCHLCCKDTDKDTRRDACEVLFHNQNELDWPKQKCNCK